MAADPRFPLLGRDKEKQVIAAAIDELQGGRGRVLMFSGEPGIGKSTLARWTADYASGAGIDVSWGYAWEAGGAPAYWPWTQLFRSLLELRPQGAALLSPLAQIIPDLVDAPKDAEPGIRPEQARFRLMEGVRALLAAASAGEPVVLVLEDLHAADSDTLQLLQFVAQHVGSLPIVLVGTFRESEARFSDQTKPLWNALRQATVLPLSCLGESDVRAFVSQHGADIEAGDYVSQLLERTEGNPLYLNELLGLIRRRGAVEAAPGLLPNTLQQVICQHLESLPGNVYSALECAAIIGREFDLADAADLSGSAEEQIQELFESAVESELLQPAGPRRYRFFHIFHRDVLYAALPAQRRCDLHERRALYLQAKVESGQLEHWSELAIHLEQSGVGKRAQAVGAWREAARYARSRLAFEDAADCLARALQAFGEGPLADPVQRCDLMLDLARATLEKGDVQPGHEMCREGFRLAQTLELPDLAARAALSYGSVFVIATLDEELIGFLREALAGLPQSNQGMRARVLARLAAALQPAEDPGEPMEMAREAIKLARSTGDAEVLYDTLTSAISALMDFAPADERVALNREYAAMALCKRDEMGQFRASLRLTIDAGELGDRRLMDESIETCDRIARRIDLPHYLWRVASIQAMRCMLQGDFSQAKELLARAGALAEEAGDSGAELTLPLQQFMLHRHWSAGDPGALESARERLLEIIDEAPAAAPFIKPLLAEHSMETGQLSAAQALCGPAMLTRIFRAGDRGSRITVGRIAMLGGDDSLADMVYRSLLHAEDRCGHLGLMGSSWCGPVAQVLGELALASENREAARGHLQKALSVAEAMGALPAVARARLQLARLEESLGHGDAAAEHAALARQIQAELVLENEPAKAAPQGESHTKRFAMVPEGEFWKIDYLGKSTLLKNNKGLNILSRLVAEPGREFHVLDLSAPGGSAGKPPAEALTGLDEKAREEYRARLADIESELAEASEHADLARAEALREEKEFISREISRAFGLGGRRRPAASDEERARVNVQRRLSDAIGRIGAQLPEAGEYLKNVVKTGRYCVYNEL